MATHNFLSTELSLLISIAERGTFAAAGGQNGMTPSGVSRLVSRLEKSIGVKLLHRSTRKLSFTPEGLTLLRYARQLIDLAEEANADLSLTCSKAAGHLRVNCGTAFARHQLAPILPRFLQRYPDITVDVSVCDHRVDPIEQRFDVTIRVGYTEDSDLVGVRLGTVSRIIAASPDYLARRGTPTTAAELAQHDCLLLTGFAGQAMWPMIEDGKLVQMSVKGTVTSDSADTLLRMAVAGVGIIRLGDFLGAKSLAEGELVELFKAQHNADPKPLTALIASGRQHYPRIRAFVDFLKTEL